MPAAYLHFDGTDLFFDAVTTETTEFSASVTEHPVEQGPNVADHIRDQLDRVTLEVVVSNTPIRDVNSLYGGGFDSVDLAAGAALGNSKLKPDPSIPFTPGQLFAAVGDAVAGLFTNDPPARAVVVKWPQRFNAVKDTTDLLIEWKKKGVIGQVITPWHHFETVVITRVSPTRNAQMGDAAHISIELREIRTVSTSLVTAPVPTELRGMSAKPKGVQNPTEADDATKKSVPLALLQSLGILK